MIFDVGLTLLYLAAGDDLWPGKNSTIMASRRFMLSAWLSIILTNFYMGYIICVFNVLYMAFLLKKNQPYRLPFFENLKANWRKIGWFIWYSLLSGLTTAVVLIPTAIAMMATGKKDLSVVNFLFKGTFGLSFPVNFGVGGNDFAGRLVHNPSFFTGSLFIVGIVVYFLSKMITKRDKQAAGILVGGIFCRHVAVTV